MEYVGGIKKGEEHMTCKLKYKSKILIIKVSLSILIRKLKKFPYMFKLEGIEKEQFPYPEKNIYDDFKIFSLQPKY